MKKPVLTAALKSTAIVLMLLSAFAIAFPLMRVINGKLYKLENYALTELQEKTGLSLSYESLSPAVISGLNFKGITITDPSSDTILLHLDSVQIGYRLWPLLHGRITEAIGKVTVTGVEFHFNDEKNMQVVEKLMSFAESMTDTADRNQSPDGKSGFIMPFPVTLKDCTFIVAVKGMSGRLTLDSISLKSSSSAPYTTNVETKGSLSFIPDDTLTHIIPQITTDLKIQALLTPDLNGTFGRFELKKAEGGAFSFKDVEFAAGLDGRQLSLSVFTPDAPYGVEAWWNMESGAVHAELNATDFDPFTVISMKEAGNIVKKVSGSRIDGRFTLDGKLPGKGNSVPEFTYDVDGSVYLPPGILNDAVSASVAAAGDLTHISVYDLQVASDPFSISYYGDADITDMNLSGYLKIGHYRLPSGKNLEGEFYLDSRDHGFDAISPQLAIGDAFLTAVQLTCVPDRNSADIVLEAMDYNHAGSEEYGAIKLSGSILYGDEQYLQASLSLENEYLDNLLRYAENVLPPETGIDPALYETLSPYLLSCDMYGSTDFKTLAFNVPYAVVASTQKDGPMFLLSLDGNETNVQVSQFELVYAGQQLTASISADSNEDYSQIFFSSDFMLNEVPYYFSGVYDKGKEVVINGDYDFELRSDLHVKNEILCSLYADTIPVRFKDYLFSLSLDTDIDFTNLENFFVTMNRFEVSESSGKFSVEPRIELAGFADRYGFMLDTLSYADSVSLLTGNGTASWGITKTDLESLSLNLDLLNSISYEQVKVDLSAFADSPVPITSKDLLKEFYVSGSVEIDSLFMSHLLEHQTQEDKISMSASILGQLSNPSIQLNVNEVLMHAAGFPLSASALFTVEDKLLSGTDINCTYTALKLEDFAFDLSLEDMLGSGTGIVGISVESALNAQSPVTYSFGLKDETDGEQQAFDLKTSSYGVNLIFEDIKSNYDVEIKDYPIALDHYEGMLTLSAGPEGGITGYILDSGEFGLAALADFPVCFNGFGSYKNNMLDIEVGDISGDFAPLSAILKNDQFSLDRGQFEGYMKLEGNIMDPDFNGEITVRDLSLNIPGYISAPLTAPLVTLVAEGTSFKAENVLFNVGTGEAIVDLGIEMEGWSLADITMSVRSINKTLIPTHFSMSFADCVADADVNLKMNLSGKDISITGGVSVYNGIVELHTGAVQDESESAAAGGRVFIDVSVNMNQKAELYYPDKDNPLIRGLVTTQEPVRLIMDSDTAEISLTGSLALRGGEILYLNRNFYLREGSIEFNENGTTFDPRISFRAEIRERDAEGETVKINLSADRQRLSALSPVLSSTPGKTEDEIRLMLGAALVADSGSTPGEVLASVAASGFDFLLQNSLFRQLENRLRDLCKFDIFSFRTPFIQQALLSAMNNSEEPTSLGNFLDNTTVYIGKYIGNTIYLDAMFRFVYQENNSGEGVTHRLAFQPEVGLELPSPFATIRWSIAPDITSAKNLWVPYTSISLSWSFKF